MLDTFASEYLIDGNGHKVRIRLTHEETVEFEALDASLPYDREWIWPDKSLPLLPMEKRWLELWKKHEAPALAKAGRSTDRFARRQEEAGRFNTQSSSR
jgi:hypothetical protein